MFYITSTLVISMFVLVIWDAKSHIDMMGEQNKPTGEQLTQMTLKNPIPYIIIISLVIPLWYGYYHFYN